MFIEKVQHYHQIIIILIFLCSIFTKMDNEHQVQKILHAHDHSTTLVKEIKCSVQWTIYNFSFFAQGDESSIAPNYAPDIESPLFKYGCNNELIWDINIVNLRNLEEEYVKVYVYINDVQWYEYMSLNVKVSILDNEGKEAHTIKYSPSILSVDSVNLIKKDFLMNKDNNLLNDDKLVILCEVSASAEVCTYPWNADDDEDDPSEDKECASDIFRSKLKVSQDLQNLLQNNVHDSTIAVKKKHFHVHKCILAARSRVFSAMFERDMLEQASNLVIIKDMNSKTLENIIDFIYSGTIKNINDIQDTLLLEILMAAEKYELNELKEICECIYSTKLLFSNAVEMLSLADCVHADKLKKFVMRFILAHQEFAEDAALDTLLNTLPHLAPLMLEEKSELLGDESLNLSADSNDREDGRSNCIYHIHLPQKKSKLLEGKQWSMTEICVDKASCVWEINQIGLLFSKDTSNYIASDKFSNDKSSLSWQLFLYYRGVNNDSKDYMSLLIQFTDGTHCNHKMQAQYEFGIQNGKGETVNKVKSDLITFSINTSILGENKFIKRDLLFNKRKNFLRGHILVIKCNVKFGLNTRKHIYQSNILHYCEQKYLLAVSDDLEHLLETGKCSDIALSIKGKEFLVHRAILAARSPLLLNTIDELYTKQQKNTIEINDIDPTVFREVVLFVYSGKVNNLKGLSKSLHAEASRFQLGNLKSICEIYLCKNLTLENVCDNFVFAHINNVKKLKTKCSLFITDNLKAVITTDGYKSLAESRPRLLKDLLLDRRNS